jgi:hypothetical protein
VREKDSWRLGAKLETAKDAAEICQAGIEFLLAARIRGTAMKKKK